MEKEYVSKIQLSDKLLYIKDEENRKKTKLNREILKIVDNVDCIPYAQVSLNLVPAQGITIFTHTDNIVYCVCAYDGGFYVYNFLTGELIKTLESTLIGHCNGITYYDGYLYVGGVDNSAKITKISVDNYSMSQFTLDDDSIEYVHGIEYYDGKFYVLCKSNGKFFIFRYNTDFTEYDLKQKVEYGENITNTQDIAIDNGFLYLIGSRPVRTDNIGYYNVVQCYDIDDFSYIKKFYLPYAMEIEGIAFYGDKQYFYYNCNSRVGVICVGDIYQNTSTYGATPKTHFNFGRFNNNVYIYLDENGTNFFCDGSQTKPFIHWYECSAFMIKEHVPYYNLMLLSDMTKDDFSIHSNLFTALYIYGVDGIKNISCIVDIRLLKHIYLNNVALTGETSINTVNRVQINKSSINSDSCTIENCNTLTLTSTNLYKMFDINSVANVQISGNYEAINQVINSNRLIGNIRVSNLPTNITELGEWFFMLTSCTSVTLDTYELCSNVYTKTPTQNNINIYMEDNQDILNLKASGYYVCGANNNVLNSPSNKYCVIKLTHIRDCRIFEAIEQTTAITYKRVVRDDGTDTGWVKYVGTAI
jgi:hypothetical protein